MDDYSIELNTAKRAAKSASVIIEKFQAENSFAIKFKGKNDIVTDADIAVEKEILSIIKRDFPNDHILAEETQNKSTLPDGRVWLIDPIDGTTNFAHGFPLFCVSIGLWEDGDPKMGLVLEVNRNEFFTALKGKGAYLNGHPMSVSKCDDLSNALVGTGFPYNDLSLVDDYLKFFHWLIEGTQGVRRPGAASYDLCCVAAGRFDGFYEYALSPWDVGAAALIVQEAGGVVTDWEGEDNWLLGKRILAGNDLIHKELLEALHKHFSADSLTA